MKKIIWTMFLAVSLQSAASEYKAQDLGLNSVDSKLMDLLRSESVSVEEVQNLIDQGANVNYFDIIGENPLGAIIDNPFLNFFNKKNVIITLLNNHANPQSTNQFGESALTFALRAALDPTIIELLIHSGKFSLEDLNFHLNLAVAELNESLQYNDPDRWEVAVNAGYLIFLGARLQGDPIQNDKMYQQIANIVLDTISAYPEVTIIINNILNVMPQIISKDTLSLWLIDLLKTGNTPIECLQYLINVGADVNFEDANRNSTLIYALGAQNALDVILLLINNGANFDHKNNDGESVHDWAVSYGYTAEQIEDMYLTSVEFKNNHQMLEWQNSLILPFDPIP